eukprot:gene20525-24641_t
MNNNPLSAHTQQGGAGGIPKSLLKFVPEPLQPIFENPFFSAGFGLIGLGSIMALGRKGFQASMIQARRYCFVSVEIPSRDKSFHWLMEWLATKKNKNTRHVSVETTFHQHESGEVLSRINFVPSVGTHYVVFGKRVIKVDRTREKNVVDMSSGALWESITLTTPGFSRDVFANLLEEARILAAGREEGKTVIYTSMGAEWRRFGHPRKKRPVDTVVLDKGVAATIIDDVTRFLANQSWYTARGIPYRRGYLLHGPPGTGKSSFITALAGELQLGICILNLAGKNVSDASLNQLLSAAPQRSIILLEDIDAAINTKPVGDQPQSAPMQYQYGNQQFHQPSSQLTFSGLLNALDGVAASEGRILFMTTNHIEKLDRVLIRPGRVDLTIEMGLATSFQIEGMFLKFFPGETGPSQRFVELVPAGRVSPAQLQAYFMQHSQASQDAIDNYQQLLN